MAKAGLVKRKAKKGASGKTPKRDVDAPEAETTARPERYSFPSVSRCPRCGALDTEVRSTQGQTQYRRCRRPTCRHTYKVIGELVE